MNSHGGAANRPANESRYSCFDLSGRTVLVTGSSRGIGRATALLLGKAGANVIFHGSRPSAALEATLDEARAHGIICRAVTGEVGTEADKIAREAGSVDILILNASVQRYMRLEEFDPVEFDREFSVNVRGSFELVHALLPGMCERGFGRIVTVGSVNSVRPGIRLSVYASTKAAQRTLMLNIARNYGCFGVTANNVSPGVITTDRNRETLKDVETASGLRQKIPLGRFGTPEDCAGIMLLLVSDAGNYITGADIPVDGGMAL